MKKSLILSMTLCLTLQSNAFAQANSCGLTTEEVDAINLASGLARLGLLSNATTYLENPNLIKPVGDPAASDSTVMYSLTEMYGASEAVANEQDLSVMNDQMGTRCNDQKAMEEAKVNGTLQIYAQGCAIYNLTNRVTNLISERDTLEKQLIEDKATMNKASAENAKREAEVKKKKSDMEEVNKKLTSAIKEIDKAKSELSKAKEALASAQAALAAASATQCPEDDDGSCASARQAAIDAAQKAVDAAKKKVDAAEKKLKAAVTKLLNYLVDKLGVETGAVLALMSGTIRGETDGGDVSFKISSSEYTLADLGGVLKDLTGTSEERVKAFINDDDVSMGTTRFVELLIGGYDRSEDRNHSELGDVDATGSSAMYYGVLGLNNQEANREILGLLGSMENGIDYLTTIALATQDYNEQRTQKQITTLEAQKTPQGRMDEMGRKMDEKNDQVAKLKSMATKTICYINTSLTLYKDLFKSTTLANAAQDPFYVYLNTFTTDKLTKKVNEGYFSKVNYKGVQKALECYAKAGATANSCKALEDEAGKEVVETANSCHWSGPVFGPSKPVTSPVCDSTKIGQVTTNDSGNELTCKCQ